MEECLSVYSILFAPVLGIHDILVKDPDAGREAPKTYRMRIQNTGTFTSFFKDKKS